MRTRSWVALAIVAAVVVAVALVAWGRVAQHRADQEFLEKQRQVVTEDAGPPDFDEEASFRECERQWRISEDGRRFWEIDTVDARPSIEVSEGLHTVMGTAYGTDGRKGIEKNFSCTVLLDDDEWVVELI